MADSMAYSIRDLEHLSGIPAHTIRTWERRYGLLKPQRDAGNARCYDAEDISHLRHLALLLKEGHRISVLSKHSREEIAALAEDTIPAVSDNEITPGLCMALQEFDLIKVENLINCYCRKEGFEAAFRNHLAPFLDQLSFFVLTGVLQPAHTQFFTSVLRQKVCAEIDTIPVARDSARWLMLYEDNASDSIYRDIMHYLLRKSGKQVIVAGTLHANTLQLLLEKIEPSGYCLVATGENPGFWLQNALSKVPSDAHAGGKTLALIPGKTLEFVNNSQIEGIQVLRGLKDAFNHLNV